MRINPWPTALAVLVLSSGCLTSQPTGLQPAPSTGSTIILDDGQGGQVQVHVAKETGAILGRVRDDAGFVLQDAHVSLLTTDNATKTNQSGWFQFLALNPGTYQLRVDHAGFRAAESKVPVTQGNVTRLNVTMLPREEVGAGYRPHVHDYWAGRKEVVILESNIEWGAPRYSSGYGWVSDTQGKYTRQVQTTCTDTNDRTRVGPQAQRLWLADADQLIWMGTARIEVRLSWTTADYGWDKLGLLWHPADTRNVTLSPWISNGAWFSIPVEPNMWDSGHQRFTLWEFWLCRDASNRANTDPVIRFVTGKIHVTMKIIRGDDPIPPEPPHPRFWDEGFRRPVVNTTFALLQLWSTDHAPSNPSFSIVPKEGSIVPPGTRRLDIWLNWTTDLPVGNDPLSVSYRPANGHPRDFDTGAKLRTPPPMDRSPNHRLYAVETLPAETDAFYQKLSNWLFFLSYEGKEGEPLFVNACVLCNVRVSLTVTAVGMPGAEA